jgi:hypothetical protein
MLEVQGAKPLIVERNKYKSIYFKNDEFHCKIHDGKVYQLTYAPKCDIETYMFTWKNKILARYIKTCIRYYAFTFPEFKTIEITDQLAIHCDRQIQNAHFMFLSTFSIAFFMQPWCVRYLQAEPEEDLDFSPLITEDRKYPPHLGLLMIKSMAPDYEIERKYNKVFESYKTLADFLKLFTKRSRFMDCITWLPGVVYHEVHKSNNVYKIPIPSQPTQTQTFDSVVYTDVEYFEDIPYFNPSASEIVIRNQIIYTTSLTWADVEHDYDDSSSSKSAAASSSNPTTDSKTDSSEHT